MHLFVDLDRTFTAIAYTIHTARAYFSRWSLREKRLNNATLARVRAWLKVSLGVIHRLFTARWHHLVYIDKSHT